MNVYDYVADTNPFVAREIINQFGYQVRDKNNMGENLKKLVSNEGEPALKLVLANHPDKDIILEMFSEKEKPLETKSDCTNCKDKKVAEQFLNANGVAENNTSAKTVENNFSVVFLAGIVVIAFAILSKK
jgi:hypothetical protein